jgi:hypothetical protein
MSGIALQEVADSNGFVGHAALVLLNMSVSALQAVHAHVQQWLCAAALKQPQEGSSMKAARR